MSAWLRGWFWPVYLLFWANAAIVSAFSGQWLALIVIMLAFGGFAVFAVAKRSAKPSDG